MTRISCRWSTAVLVIVIVCTVTSCSGTSDVAPIDVEKQAFDDLRSEVRMAIGDPARETEAIVLVDALALQLDSLRERISERRRRAKQLNADYDTSRADFEAFFDQVNSQIRSTKRQVSEAQRALFAVTTADERAAISKAHTKAMDAAIRHIQTI